MTQTNNNPTSAQTVRWTKHYLKLCNSRKNRILVKEKGYHLHHIIPKCFGGNDSNFNLVKLTIKEHVIAHLLLIKMFPKSYKLSKAFNGLLNKVNSKTIVKLIKESNYRHSKEIKTIISKKTKESMIDLKIREKCSLGGKLNKGKRKPLRSKSHCLKLSEIAKKRIGPFHPKNVNCPIWRNRNLFYKLWISLGRPKRVKLAKLINISSPKRMISASRYYEKYELTV